MHDRYAFDAFTGTELERLLRGLSVAHLFICGFTTDQCVSRTLRTALARGFDGHLVSDCTATFLSSLQRRVERRLGARAVGHRDLLRRIAATRERLRGIAATDEGRTGTSCAAGGGVDR